MNAGFYIDNHEEIYLTHLRKKLDLIDRGESNLSLSGWIASEHCIFFQSHPPVRKRAAVLKTLPYMLEEYLIEPIENYHFSFIIKGRDEPVFSCVTTHDKMKKWLEMLDIVAIQPQAFYPDIYALPYQEDSVSVFIAKDRCLARTGYYEGFCGKGPLFYKLLKEKTKDVDLDIITDHPQSVPSELRDQIILETEDWLSYLSEQPMPNNEVNLLHSDYAPKTRNQKATALKTIGWAAAVLFAAFSVQQFLSFEAQQRDIAEQRQRNADLYQQMFGQPLSNSEDLRANALAAMTELADKQVGDQDPNWELMVSLSELLNKCSPCLVNRFKLEGQRVEMEVEARNKEPISRQQLQDAGWRMQSWRNEEKDVPQGAQPVFQTTFVMTNR